MAPIRLEAHGQYRPLVVQRSSGVVLAGNHTLLALRALGHPEAMVTYVDVDNDEALRILLVDNRLSDLAAYDDAALIEILAELAAGTDLGLTGTGFDAEDLSALVADLNTPFPDALASVQAPERLDGHQEHRCPSCGHGWAGVLHPGALRAHRGTGE